MRNPLSSNIRSKLIALGVLAFLPIVLLITFNFIHQRNLEIAEARGKEAELLRLAVIFEEEAIQNTHRILAVLAENQAIRIGGKPADAILARILKDCPEYANLGVARPDGKVISSAFPLKGTVNLSDRPYIRDAIRRRAFSTGRYQVGRITGKPSINFGYPLLDRHGNVDAVLFAALDLSRVTKLETEVGGRIPAKSSYVKIDHDGGIVSAYPGTQVFAMGQPLDKSLFERISREKTGTFQAVGADGVERLYLFSPFRGPLDAGRGYALLGIPTRSLFKDAGGVFNMNLAVLSAVVALLMAIIWFAGNAMIVRRVAAIVDASNRLAGGDLTARSGLASTDDELGRLGQAFDEMAGELQRRHDESRTMQETLRETSDYLENLLGYANAPVIVWNPASRITRFNRAFERLTGFTADEVVGRELRMLFPEGSREESLSKIGRALSGERWESVEIPILRKDGEIRIALWNSANIHGGDGATLVATIAQGQDITARKQAEKALQASEAKYRLLIENAGEAIFIAQDGAIRYSNPTARRTMGYAEEYLASTPFVTLVHPDDREMVAMKQERRLRGEDLPETYSFRIRNMAGDELWLDLNSALIHWEGRPATLNFARDITPRKLLESQLLAFQRMEAVGRLAGGVAHDFNNLLTVILGFSEVLGARFPAGDPCHREIGEIRKAGERAQGLTRQLLAFSRRQILQARVVNINSILSGMHPMLRRLIGEDIDIVTRLDDGLWNVKADPGQIEQVVMNVAVNARDAMPRGGKLTIETTNVVLTEEYSRSHLPVPPGPYVLLAMSDTGTGMDAETASKIFEPFFTTKERGKGTGLGLSTVYGIVKQSGGFVWAYSEPGRGSTFKVYLPRTEDRRDLPDKAAGSEERLGGEGTVLVVEDEESIRNLAVEILGRYGYTALAAGNGEEALRIAATHGGTIDLLLTDVVMPGMGGRGVYERLRLLRPGIKVLYMSGYTDNALVDQGGLDPGIAFLQKPYSPSSLARKVKEVLTGAQTAEGR